jgi:hypothetical protein
MFPTMIFAKTIEPDAAASMAVFTFFYMLLGCVVAGAVRAWDLKLILLGLLTGIAAIWYAALAGDAVSVQAGQVGLSLGAWGIMGRLAMVLVLGGLAVTLWTRCNIPEVPTGPRRDVP